MRQSTIGGLRNTFAIEAAKQVQAAVAAGRDEDGAWASAARAAQAQGLYGRTIAITELARMIRRRAAKLGYT